MPVTNSAPIWPQWLALTRLLFSGQIAFNSEIARWASTEFDDEHGVRLRDKSLGTKYRVTLDQHLAALENLSTFYGVIILKGYSLMEFHGRYIKFILNKADYKLIERVPSDAEVQAMQEIELAGGIEGWGTAILKSLGRDWKIIDGKNGLIEVAIVRNAVAHGYPRFTQELYDNAISRGVTPSFQVGAPVGLSFQECRTYLSRIKSFCRRLDGGIINLI